MSDTQQSLESAVKPEADGGRSDPSTNAARSKQSPPYLVIGAGLLVVVGAFVGQWILSPIPSSMITRYPSIQNEGITPDPQPAPMVLVPAGEFMMGARQDDNMAGQDERTAHRVQLDAFYIDQYEVTTARYARFLRETKRPAPKFWSDEIPQRYGNKPVIGVDWNDAAAYCARIGKRLPTEAEWERAARGTDQRLYPWGNASPNDTLANLDRCCNVKGYEALTDDGSFESGKSPYGAYDMAGNVWEWVADWYDGDYYGSSPERNPTGPSTGEKRVLRGGAGILLRPTFGHWPDSNSPPRFGTTTSGFVVRRTF